MKADEEIIKIFKKKMKFEIGCTFVGMFTAILCTFLIIVNCIPDGLTIAFIVMILFGCIALIYELYVRFYNLKSIKEGNYSICINHTVGSVNSDSRGGLSIRVKDCDEDFGFISDDIENFSNKVYCVTTKKGTYPVCFCKEDI